MKKAGLSPAEKSFYARQIRLPEIGQKGQERLKNSSVLLIGLGGLGSPLSLYLAAAGVGRIGVFEFDQIEISNLHRQILYGTSQEGRSKIEEGVSRLRDLNPHIEIEAYPVAISSQNARETIRKYDVVADGADNFKTRFLVNDACVLENKPLVSASILGFEGQLSVFHDQEGPCYRCLYPSAPPAGSVPSCAEGGVLGVLPGVMGTLQATEVIKVLLRLGEPMRGRLLCYNALSLSFQTLHIARDPDCPVCGEHPSILEVREESEACAPGAHKIQEISAAELRADLRSSAPRFLVIDVRESDEREESKIDSSVHVPLNQILEGKYVPPGDHPMVLYCHSGSRSLLAAEALASRGHARVFQLTGGILAWLKLK